jgi:6,7-dimethyl-8-ribityllumazine synthase
MKRYEGKLTSSGLKIAIVASRYNEFMSNKLLEGALDALTRTGADEKDISVFKVPGAFELPQMTAKLARSDNYDGIISLGVLIRGATPHFDYISAEATKGIAQSAMDSGIPISFGLLTTDTLEQAIERSGSKGGNKGFEAAMAVIEMANLYKEIK